MARTSCHPAFVSSAKNTRSEVSLGKLVKRAKPTEKLDKLRNVPLDLALSHALCCLVDKRFLLVLAYENGACKREVQATATFAGQHAKAGVRAPLLYDPPKQVFHRLVVARHWVRWGTYLVNIHD